MLPLYSVQSPLLPCDLSRSLREASKTRHRTCIAHVSAIYRSTSALPSAGLRAQRALVSSMLRCSHAYFASLGRLPHRPRLRPSSSLIWVLAGAASSRLPRDRQPSPPDGPDGPARPAARAAAHQDGPDEALTSHHRSCLGEADAHWQRHAPSRTAARSSVEGGNA